MDFETLLAKAEKNPDDGALIASLLVRSAQVKVETLPDSQQERVYNLFAFVFANLESGPHNALQTALQRALSQPAVLEFYLRRMEASAQQLRELEGIASTTREQMAARQAILDSQQLRRLELDEETTRIREQLAGMSGQGGFTSTTAFWPPIARSALAARRCTRR